MGRVLNALIVLIIALPASAQTNEANTEIPEFLVFDAKTSPVRLDKSYVDKLSKVMARAQKTGFLVSARITRIEEFDIMGEIEYKKSEKVLWPVVAGDRKGADPDFELLIDFNEELRKTSFVTRITLMLYRIPQLTLVPGVGFEARDKLARNGIVTRADQDLLLKKFEGSFPIIMSSKKMRCLSALSSN